MKCMENLHRAQIPNDVIVDYLDLYKSIGINKHNQEILEQDYDVMVRQTVRNDTYYFSKIFDIKVSDSRFKSLVYKGVKPKNKNEILVTNIFNAFTKIHEETSSFELLVSEVQDLIRFLYNDILPSKSFQFRKTKSDQQQTKSLLTSSNGSTRETLEYMIKLFNRAVEHREFEVSYLILNFYVDFIHVKPFNDKNEEVALMLLFVLLLAHNYEVFEFISFFEKIYNQKDEFDQIVVQSGFNWGMGYAQILPLHKMILDISLKSYETLNYLVRDYQFDQHLNKSDNVENTITKLDDVFCKDDIRNLHPYISDSTINRTLKRLRDEKKIRPLGKGRSAKWIKLEKKTNKKLQFEQLGLKI